MCIRDSNYPEPQYQRWLQQGQQPLDGGLHLPVVGVGHLDQHLLQLAGFFADPDHLHRQLGKIARLLQRFGQPPTCLGVFGHLAQRCGQDLIAQGLADDGQRVQQRHPVAEQGSQRSRQAGGFDLSDQVTEQRQPQHLSLIHI